MFTNRLRHVRHCAAVLTLWALTAPAWSQAGTEVEPAPASASAAARVGEVEVGEAVAAAEKVVVPGQRPGPGLWKVSKGDHVLWVFGTYSPLPKGMEWRAGEVEAAIAQSQEYLENPGVMAEVGFFRQLTLLPFAIGFKKNPDGAKLKDLLPEPVYARWLVLKKKYIGEDDGIERERPIFVADTLYRKGLEQAGLVSDEREVRKIVDLLVKKNNIKRTSTAAKLEIDDPLRMLRDYKKTPLDDAACFANTLAQLEDDIAAMRVRANAWAKGDLEEIQRVGYADRDGACTSAVLGSALIQSRPGLKSAKTLMKDSWVAAAEKALAANRSTFAILPIRDLLDPKGFVAELQDRGYAVRTPE